MGRKKWFSFTLVLSLFLLLVSLSACGPTTGSQTENPPTSHTHTFASTWSYDDEYHWHESTCGHDEVSDKAKHTFVDGVCTVCGYKKNSEMSNDATVTFSAGEGAFNGVSKKDIKVQKGSLVSKPENPTRDGFVFIAWSKDKDIVELWKFDEDKVNGDITLFAIWLEEFTITLDANGGKFQDDKEQISLKLAYGTKLSNFETPENNGYNFNGWFLDKTSLVAWDLENSTITGSVTLFAGWLAPVEEHDVTFVLNYPNSKNEVRSTVDGKVTFTPERTGYVFNGWWYSDGLTDEGYILSRRFDNSKIVEEDGLRLYAEWVEESTVASQLQAPSVGINDRSFSWGAVNGAVSYNVRVYRSGDSEELVNETITSTSWSFPSNYEAGYYNVRIRANGDGINTVNSSYVSKSYAHNILSAISNINFDISTSVLTWAFVKNAYEYELYIDNELVKTTSMTTFDLSNYEAGRYSIKIISKRDGYISSSTSQTIEKKRLKTPTNLSVIYNLDNNEYNLSWSSVSHADTYIFIMGDKQIRLINNFYKINISSKYWEDGIINFEVQAFDSTADYLISEATETITIEKLYPLSTRANIEAAGEIGINGKIFVPASYTINFDLNGATGNIKSQIVDYNNPIKYPSIPFRTGYVFRGWYKDKECTQLYSFNSLINSDITLYAGWHKIATSGKTNTVVDITSSTNSPSTQFSASAYSTSSTNANYVYFSTIQGGTFSFVYKTSVNNSSYGTYFYVYNVTKNTVVVSNKNVYSTTSSTIAFDADAGDVFYVRNYKYSSSSSYYGDYMFYITGSTVPEIEISTHFNDYIESNKSGLADVFVPAGKEISITATTKDDRYIFDGWYNNDELVTKDRIYIFEMPSDILSYEARWIYYSVAIVKDEAGEITNWKPEPYKVGEEVTVTANQKNGYTWLGWYEGEKLLTNDYSYSFNMPEGNVEYIAKWILCPVSLEKNIEEAGTVTGVSGPTMVGEQTTVTATTSDGYAFLGWYNGEEELTKEMNYTFTMPSESIVLSAKWTFFTVTTATSEVIGGNYTKYNALKISPNKNITLTASVTTGYTWLGWYNGDEELTKDYNYSFEMPFENVTYTAKWILCPVTITQNIGEAGQVSGMKQTTVIGEEITLTVSVNSGYTWLGWYKGDEELTKETSYKFNITTDAVAYEARYVAYTITTTTNDSAAGTYTKYSDTKVTAGKNVSLSANINSGYTFVGWFDGNIELTKESKYTFEMPAKNITYEARYVAYTITTITNDSAAGTYTKYSDNKVTLGTSITLTANNNTGYTFVGWYEGEEELTKESKYTFEMPAKNITYEARYVAYTITTTTNDATGGTYTIKSEEKVTLGTSITLTATANEGYTFVGWYDGVIELTKESKYTFEMPAKNITYEAKFMTYTLTLKNTEGGQASMLKVKVKFDMNGAELTAPKDQIITDTSGITNLSIPKREGYLFTGWYTEKECNNLFDFTSDINKDITLYAGWYSIGKNKSIEVGAYSSSSAYSVSLSNTSSTSPVYVYFRALKSDNYTLGYKNGSSSSSYQAYYSIYDETTNTSLVSNTSLTSTSFSTRTLSLVAGHIYYVKLYRYNSSYSPTVYLYLSGTTHPSYGGRTSGNTIVNNYQISAGEIVKLRALIDNGYTFIGWYDGNDLISNDLNYSFAMPESVVTYEARFIPCPLTLNVNDVNAGSVDALPTTTVAGQDLTIQAVTNPGYTFVGWFKENEFLSNDLKYTIKMPSTATALEARFIPCPLTLVSTNEEAGSIIPLPTATIAGKDITIEVETNDGYTFIGWFNGEQLISNKEKYTLSMPSTTLTYQAKWSLCLISLEKNIEEAGDVSGLEGPTCVGEEVSVVAKTNIGYIFIGWFNGEEKLSDDEEYTFEMPSINAIYQARWEFYTLTINKTFGGAALMLQAKVEFDLNGGEGKAPQSQLITDNVGLVYPSVPKRTGYLFTGWYKEKECVNIFDFTSNIDNDLTLYAGWYSIGDNKNIEIDAYNSSKPLVISLANTSSSNTINIYFRVLKSGDYKLGYKNGSSSSSYQAYYSIYDETTNRSLVSNTSITSTGIFTKTLSLEIGHIYYLKLYRNDTNYIPSISIYLSGGLYPDAGGKAIGNYEVDNYKITAGNTIKLKAITEEGYIFDGWYEEDNKLTDNLSYTFEMPKKNIVYTAKWHAYTLTVNKTEGGSVDKYYNNMVVSFDLLGGNGNISSQTVTYESGLKYPNTIPTKAGHIFTGWYADSDCTILYDFTKKIQADFTLYAGWYELSGNVIEINEYSSSVPYVVNTDGTSSSNPDYIYFRALRTDEYKFGFKNGTSSSTSYSTYLYIYDVTASKVIRNNDYYGSTSYKIENYTLEAGHVYYARIYRYSTSYTTNFSFYLSGTLLPMDGGVCDVIEDNDVRMLPGKKIALCATTDRNYTFLGWYNGEEKLSDDLIYTFVMPSENVIYEAKWAGYTLTVSNSEGGTAKRILTKKVYFNNNYSGGEVTEQLLDQDSELKYFIPTREDYIFKGWYEEKECRNLYDFEKMIYDDITLYAGWSPLLSSEFMEVNQYSSSSPLIISTDQTTSSSPKYVRFRALVSGTYTLGYKLDSSTSTYLYIYDYTSATEISSNSTHINTLWETNTLQLTAGHVYYLRAYRYNNYYTNLSLYLLGKKLPKDGGKIEFDNKIAAGNDVKIKAETIDGYTWVGWFDGEEKVSDDLIYSFKMPNKSVNFEARWTCYTVTTSTNAKGGGTYTSYQNKKIADKEKVTLTASINDGYTWVGWFEDNELLTDETTYQFVMGTKDRNIKAIYGYEEVMLYYIVDGDIVYFEPMTFESNLELLYNFTTTANFNGWYAVNSCNKTDSKVTETSNLSADIENKVYLYGATYIGTEGLEFKKVEGGYKVVDYNGQNNFVVIPSTYNGIPVIAIGDEAFKDNNSLYKITIPSSITSIGNDAFLNCYRLVEINNLSNIEITIGSNANGNIGYYAIKINKIETNNDNVINNDGFVFYYDGDSYYLIDYKKEESNLILPDSINDNSYYVSKYVFYDNKILESVEIGDGILGIDDYAFGNCSNITTISIGKNVSEIKELAFYLCGSLIEINLDDDNTYFSCIDNNLVDISKKTLIIGCSDNILDDGSIEIIGSYAFAMRKTIKNISINENIKEIKPYAFYQCNEIETLVISAGLESIGEYAFYGAKYNSLIVPSSVTSIGYAALGGNGSIISISLPFVGANSSKTMQSEDTLFGYVFGKEKYTNSKAITQYYASSANATYYLPNNLMNVTIRGGKLLYGAFYGCDVVVNLTANVTSVGEKAFYNFTAAKSIVISNALTIGNYAFGNCYSLAELIIPSVTSIGDSILYGCNGLESLSIPFVGNNLSPAEYSENSLFGYLFGKTEYKDSIAVEQNYKNGKVVYYLPKYLKTVSVTRGKLAYGAFYNCNILESISLTNVSSIGDYAFYNCTALNNISLGNGFNEIGNYAFANCSLINKITIPSSVSAINSYAFYNCSSLSEVTFAGDLTSIKDHAFENCGALTSISIPNSVTTIGSEAFANTGLLELKLPSSLNSTGLGNGIIKNCSSLTSLSITGSSIYTSLNNLIIYNRKVVLGCSGSTIPTSSSVVTAIGAYAFYGSYNNSSITIPSNITSIENYALAYTSMTNITIPSSVTAVGEHSFANCSKLKTVEFKGSTTTIGKYAFSGSTVTNVTLPSNLTLINEGLFYSCTKLGSITIPSTVTSIGEGAFYYCGKLTSIVVPNSVTTIGKGAFANCTSLTAISLPFIGGSSSAQSASPTTLFGYIFGSGGSTSGTYSATQYYSASASITYIIPSSLNTVNITTDSKLLYGSFQNCSNISNINLYSSSTITEIPNYAFYNSGITTITIPDTVVSIGESSFNKCSKLLNIAIPNGVTSLAEGTLYGCGSLKDVTLPFIGASATQTSRSAGYPFGYIFGTTSFSGTKATAQKYISVQYTSTYTTTTYYIPTSLISVSILNYTSGYWGSSGSTDHYIVSGAFYGCSNLTSVSLPNETNYIMSNAFYECKSLASITIPNTVTSIGDEVFFNCTKLASVVFSGTSKLDRIGTYAFKKCESLTSITLPTSLTKMLADCFAETGLTSLTVPANVNSDNAGIWISDCKKLTTIKFNGTKVTVFGAPGCSSLTSVTLPTSLTTIGSFEGCVSLTSITIPANVTTINTRAFSGCTSLKTVTFTNNSSSSNKLTTIGYSAFSGCSALTSIIIPVNVTTIEMYAFSGCSALTSVTFRTTSNWKIGSTSMTVTNAATNATNLTNNYSSSKWTRG